MTVNTMRSVMPQVTDRLHSLTVADVMSKHVVEIAPDQTLDQAATVFANKDVSSAPVIDSKRQCVGVLSAVDFLRRSSNALHATVGDRMSKEVKSVGAQEPLLKAAQMMCDKHIHRLPVIGNDHRVVGVISTMDIVAAVLNALDEADASPFLTTGF